MTMNTLVIVLVAAVVLIAAYTLYGRWLANKWGIDPKAQTPAVKFNDGKDFVPANGWTVFSHQFSSIAGAGPVTGAIQAAAFGWLPVLLWVLIGGVFFGAVTDFGALYASVKNEGKSMGMLIEKYIGKLGRKLFLLFCWLFCLIVIAAFADMVAGTFNAYTVVDGAAQLSDAAQTNGAAGMVSIMFMVFAVVMGLIQKKWNLTGWKEAVLGIVCILASFAVGMNCPLIFGKATWSYITFIYIFFAAVLPMWLLKQPRDYMTTFMFICMIAGAVVGLLVAHPTMNLPVFTGFTNEKLGTMFPILFVTVDRLRQHLAPVRFCKPAAERSGSGYPVRLPEGHRPQQQDALPPADHHAVRHLYRAGSAAAGHGEGHPDRRCRDHPHR